MTYREKYLSGIMAKAPNHNANEPSIITIAKSGSNPNKMPFDKKIKKIPRKKIMDIIAKNKNIGPANSK